MPLDSVFACPLPNGIHARPASAMESVTRRFLAHITIVNERTGASANAKSVLGILGLDIRLGDRCRITVDGADADEARAAVSHFLEHDFARCDVALPMGPPAEGAAALPPALNVAGAEFLRGKSVVPGIGRGRVTRLGAPAIPAELIDERVEDANREAARLETASHALDEQYADLIAHRSAGVATSVVGAHHAIARDPAFRDFLADAVRRDHCSAARAIALAETHFSAMLASSDSQLLRERALDIKDVCRQLFQLIYGNGHGVEHPRLTGDAVCIADDLTPGDFLALDRTYLKGLILAHSASTSHTIVLARAFGIPTLSGIAELGRAALDGRDVIIDADLGLLVTTATDAVRRYYAMEDARIAGRRARLQQSACEPASTRDGQRVEVGANIATAAEASVAFGVGADGIGVFRTEMLFANREAPPDEDEQFEAYRQVLTAAARRPVIIRTLDVGGDKHLTYLRLPEEANPFLGYRAVRMYADFHVLMRTQLRALVRASAFGQLKIMVPMISRLDEVAWVRRMIVEEQVDCAGTGVAYDTSMQIGAMVEVPAMAFQLDHFCRDLDFFSIGTNDLLQYFLAVDRTNDRIAHLYDPMAPAFLRLLRKIVDDIHAGGRWVGVCGELGGQARALPLFVGLGIDELSMAAPGIAAAKAAVRSLDAASCRALVDQALACSSGPEVEHLLAAFDVGSRLPLVSPDLVVIDADCATREEAIKTIVDQLYIAGRTEHPRAIEAAVWQREAVSSTAFGHGFAIPHCKSDAVTANSLAILKLRRPVEWASLDGQPVSIVVLLAIRQSDQAAAHLKILATLARQVMHEEFRERLRTEQDAHALCGVLLERVGG